MESEPGRGNLIVTLKGKKGDGFNLMIIGHIDVVPIQSRWSVDAFQGVEKDGYICGRGAIDDKGQIAAMVYLAILLKRINLDFKGSVRLFMVADEEIQNPKHGMRFLVKNRRDLFKGINGGIGELGGVIKLRNKKNQIVVFGEKGALSLRITIYGDKGHGSQIYRVKNSVLGLAKFLVGSPNEYFFISKPTRIMLKNLIGRKSLLLSNKLLNNIIISMLYRRDPKLAKIIHALTHITIAKTVLKAGQAENVFPEEAEAELDVRLFPENNRDRIILDMKKYVPKGYKHKIEVKSFIPPTYSSLSTPLFLAIEKTVMEMGYRPLPIFQTGSSDSAWVRKIGIPVYHFMTTTREIEMDRIHGTDERIWKEDLIKIVEGYWRLIKNLSNPSFYNYKPYSVL